MAMPKGNRHKSPYVGRHRVRDRPRKDAYPALTAAIAEVEAFNEAFPFGTPVVVKVAVGSTNIKNSRIQVNTVAHRSVVTTPARHLNGMGLVWLRAGNDEGWHLLSAVKKASPLEKS